MNISSIYKDLLQLNEALSYAFKAESIYRNLNSFNKKLFCKPYATCLGNISVIF